MPVSVYTVEIDGRQYDLQGDHPPSEEEARTAIKAQNSSAIASTPPAGATIGMLAPSTMTGDPARTLADVARPLLQADVAKYQTSADAALQSVKEHPIRTAAILAAPGIIGKVAELAPAVLQPVLDKTIQVLSNPVVGGGVGAYEGYKMGGVPGAVMGAAAGAAGSTKAKGFLDRLRPVSAAEQLGVTAPEAILARQAAAVETGPGIVERGRTAMPPIQPKDVATQAMVDRYMPNTSAEPAMAVSHTPEPPAQTLRHDSQAIRDLSHPGAQDVMQRMYDESVRMNGGKPFTASSGTVRVPPGAEINPAELRPRTLEEAYRMIGQEPYPPTAAPAAPEPAPVPAPPPRRATGRGLTAAATERAMNQATPGWHDVLLNEPAAMPSHTPEPPMPLKRPSNVSPIEQIAGTVKEEYDRLAGKAIRTPDEQMRFQQLGHIMKATGASNKGYAYATQGK